MSQLYGSAILICGTAPFVSASNLTINKLSSLNNLLQFRVLKTLGKVTRWKFTLVTALCIFFVSSVYLVLLLCFIFIFF